MALNGTAAIVSGKLAYSKKKGKAFIKEMFRMYDDRIAIARGEEGVKKATNHGK